MNEVVPANAIFAAFVAFAPFLLSWLKLKESRLHEWLPPLLRGLPAAGIVFVGAVLDSVAQGLGWPDAAINALFLTVLGAPASVGLYHLRKRAVKPEAKSGTVLMVFALVLALVALPMGPVGCAAVPAASVVASLPAIFAALGTAEAAVNTFEAWAERFKGAPGVTPELLEQIHGLAHESRASFGEARDLARKGAEFEEQAKAALNQGLDTFEALKVTLASAGLFREDRLLAPAANRSIENPDELVVPLPPRRL